MTYIHVSGIESMKYKMMTGVNVFGSWVIDIVLDMLESGIRVCKNEGRLPLRNIERGEEIAEEYGFLRSWQDILLPCSRGRQRMTVCGSPRQCLRRSNRR